MYLNQRATLQCVHGGTVMVVPMPMRSMHVMDSPVLTDQDLLKAFIIGCPQIGPGLKPCTKIVQIILGRAIQIDVDGETPILESLMALTDGVAPGIVRAVNNGQSNATPTLPMPQMITATNAAGSGSGFCEPCARAAAARAEAARAAEEAAANQRWAEAKADAGVGPEPGALPTSPQDSKAFVSPQTSFESDTANFSVEGDPDYKRKTVNHLKTIYSTPSGRALIQSLHSSGKTVRIHPPGKKPDGTTAGNWAKRDPKSTTTPYAGLRTNDGRPGTPSNVEVGFDPIRNHLPNVKDEWANPPNRPPDVGLYHELVHADDFAHGRIDLRQERTRYGAVPKTATDTLVPNAELRAVGLPPFERERISENAYRKDRRVKPRTRY